MHCRRRRCCGMHEFSCEVCEGLNRVLDTCISESNDRVCSAISTRLAYTAAFVLT